MLRSVPSNFDAETVAVVDARLDAIEREHGVAIPLAIESGSRAWGFPSPDSDYDVRFVFVRREQDYLSLRPRPDVIETPLFGELDVNGWDLAKALRLMMKGNAVILEWLRSPIAYRGDETFRASFLALARQHVDRRLIGRHHLYLGERQRRLYFDDGTSVPLKKLFYALRPAAALRWLRFHPDDAAPPMHFPTLLAQCDPPAPVAEIIAELLARKAVTRELGAGPLPAAITEFMDQEFEIARDAFEGTAIRLGEAGWSDADAFFRASIARRQL